MTQAEYECNALGEQVAEYLFDPVTSVTTLIRDYVWLGGKPLAVIEGGVVYYVRADHIGRPVFATDGTGAVVWRPAICRLVALM